MRPTIVVALLLVACEPVKGSPTEDEGASEADHPGPPTVPGIGVPTPEVDWSQVVTEPADEEVCYPGPAEDYTVCFPTVLWSEEWGGAYEYPPPLDGDPQYAAPARYLDLDAIDPAAALAPNFVVDELMQAHKGRFGLFQVHAVESIQAIRDAIGGPLVVNSGYRNVDWNASVGGATWSRHQYGDAVDIASNHASLDELADLCADLGAGYTSIYDTHVHCDWRDTPLDPAFYDVAGAGVAAGAEGRLYVVGVDDSEGEPRILWLRTTASGAWQVVHQGRSYAGPQPVALEVGGHWWGVVSP